MAKDVLYIGIDLGTFRSVMVSSDSHEVEELTVIGTPKDPIARNFLKRDVLFGEEALKNRLALNLYRPLELGVIKDTPEDREFIAHFITHLIGLSDPEEYDRVVAVIGAPAEASHVDKTAIFLLLPIITPTNFKPFKRPSSVIPEMPSSEVPDVPAELL